MAACCMATKKLRKNQGKEVLRRVKKEMAEPRMARSAREKEVQYPTVLNRATVSRAG